MTEWISAPLSTDHDFDGFDCGNEILNKWLKEQGHRAQQADTARTHVWTEEGSNVVRAYYSIAPTQVMRQEVTGKQAGGYSVIPAYLIAKLALDQQLRGQGLGSELLFDAVDLIVRASKVAAGRLIVVDAIDDAAASFYRHHDFVPVKGNPNRLVMTIATAQKALGLGSITLSGDARSHLISMVFNTPEGDTVPVVVSPVEAEQIAAALRQVPGELTYEALHSAIVNALGRDPFES